MLCVSHRTRYAIDVGAFSTDHFAIYVAAVQSLQDASTALFDHIE